MTVIAANLDVAAPAGGTVREVVSAMELQEAATTLAPGADIVIMAAAVADYRPASLSESKIKKEQQGDELTLRLVKNPDILAGLAAAKRPDQLVVGFAAETEPDRDARLALGRAKIERKGCDLLVLNRVGWSEGFATESNEVIAIDRAGDIVMEASGTKSDVADRILDVVAR